MRQVLEKLGLKYSGGNHKHIKDKIKTFNIDVSHFLGQGWNKGGYVIKPHTRQSFIAKVLKKNGKGWKSHSIKKRLVFLGLKKDACEKCNLTEWLGKPLSMHLDHKNGDNKDNRLENLRLLCPNCHSQTSTYCGKKNAKVC